MKRTKLISSITKILKSDYKPYSVNTLRRMLNVPCWITMKNILNDLFIIGVVNIDKKKKYYWDVIPKSSIERNKKYIENLEIRLIELKLELNKYKLKEGKK